MGLLGGSLCMAMRRLHDCPTVVGYAHRHATVLRVREMNLAHEVTDDLGEAVRGADLIILCTPVGSFEAILKDISPHLSPGAVVTDVGSTKRTVCELAKRHLPKGISFVGSHPMAGGERGGAHNARSDLFVDAPVILTPCGENGERDAALAAVAEFWEALHCRLVYLDPNVHDALVGSVSHLPHATAAMLVTLQSLPALELSGAGYRDSTRIAQGDPDLWRDIFMDNRDHITTGLKKLRDETDYLISLLEKSDGPGIRDYLASAAIKRGAPIRERTPMV